MRLYVKERLLSRRMRSVKEAGKKALFLQALLKLGREIRDIAKGAGKDPVIEQGGEVVRKQGKLPPDGVQGGNGDKRRERVRIPLFSALRRAAAEGRKDASGSPFS